MGVTTTFLRPLDAAAPDAPGRSSPAAATRACGLSACRCCRIAFAFVRATRHRSAVAAACVLTASTGATPASAQEAAPAALPEGLTPPEVISRVAAEYPASALPARTEATSVLAVTVDADGHVGDVEIAESGGVDFDEAAIAAVREWRFRPAILNGTAVAARVRIPFQFTPPPVDVPAAPQAAPVEADGSRQRGTTPEADAKPATAAPPEAGAPLAGPDADRPTEVTVHGKRRLRSEDRAVSDYAVDREVLEAAPRQEGAETLRTVPGLYISRFEGAAVGHRYTLRGFDADHGQDIEFRVGGIPINMPSHIHGQGYTDLGFLIADTVDEIHASEGVYDPRQGDFAVAGSIDASLGVARRGWQLRSSYGSFDTFRQVLLWAPPDQERETFGAVQYTRTDGFGQNRAGQGASAIVQSVFDSGSVRYRALGILYGARADFAGVVRADDVASGRVGFYDVYPYATARAQNAFAGRALAGFFAEYRGPAGDNAEAGVWAGIDDFRLQENFTGFTQRSRTLENVAGRGDLIEQRNRTRSVGLTSAYRTAPYRPSSWARGTVELGFAGRVDEIDQSQNLLDAAVRSQTWDRRVDASIFGADIGFWGDLDWSFSKYLWVRAGLRADALYYEVDDRLGNFVPLTRPDDSFIGGFRRSAFGVAWGPRTSAELRLLDWMSLGVAYGEGYRSPQARLLEDGEDAPYSKVRSADAGVRFALQDRYELRLSGYATYLSDDLAFEAEEGRLERIGKTRRLGATLYARARPLDWIIGALSVTYVDAELLEPPPATAEEPDPPFQPGQNLPFVPPVVARLDVGAHPVLWRTPGGTDLTGRAGLGVSYLSPRPLPYGDFADPVALVDASAGVGFAPFDLGLEVFNLLDSRYAATELNFASTWDPSGPPTRTPARHITAGAPFSWLVTLGVTL